MTNPDVWFVCLNTMQHNPVVVGVVVGVVLGVCNPKILCLVK